MKFPRFTIERLRTVVLVGGGILVAAIAIFLIAGQWKLRKLAKDLPGKLGIDIQQSANGVDYTQTRKGKTLFKIHAARAVQIKSSGKTLLHDVHIDLYGEDGTRADTISGSEFEYDPAGGIAHAAGTVEITMMRPGQRPAIAQLKPGAKPNPAPLQTASGTTASAITDNEIHVTTSGLIFNQKTGIATTDQRVDFAVRQGKGNSIGATYNSQAAELILDHAVELVANGMAVDGKPTGMHGPFTVHATHADFHRDDYLCLLTQARAEYTGGAAQAAAAQLHFREDGTVAHIYGSGGVDLRSAGGTHVTAPLGSLDFDEHNHPQTGDLKGGARLERHEPGRDDEGSAPSAHLVFDSKGELHQAHLERGVLFRSHQKGTNAKGAATELVRNWSSETADIDFAHSERAQPHNAGKASPTGHTEPRLLHGSGSVVVTSEATVNGHTTPAKLSADSVIAELAPGSVLTHLTGTGHASFEQETAQGAHQSSSSDQLDVRFAAATSARSAGPSASAPAVEIESMHQAGHVVLTQTPAAKPGAASEQAPMRATAETSDYDGKNEILHLTGSPRVQQGALDLTAQSIDFTRSTGDALARGDVRASWASTQKQPLPGASLLAASSSGNADNRSSGPVHAVAAEAELHQSTQEIFFRAAAGTAARLWQAGNSVSAPLLVLNRQKMTLLAQTNSAANPVRTVLVGNAAGNAPSALAPAGGSKAASAKSPSTMRVRSGDLRYSEGERLALFHGGVLGAVTAETMQNGSPTTIVAQQAEVRLTPAAAHGGPGGIPGASAGKASAGNTSVERMTAQGRVTVDWPERHGAGERLVYLAEDESYTLTGTGSSPPRMTDAEHGTVTGAALVYHSRDGSITVEGQGGKTSTETRSPK
jgi:lipopolysaccharide export system protein LptA